MYGYPGVIQVEKVVEDQKLVLMKQIEAVNMIIEQQENELEKLLAKLEILNQEEGS